MVDLLVAPHILRPPPAPACALAMGLPLTECYYACCRVLLSSRVGRTFIAVYLAAIHAFIFGLIYYAAWTSQKVVVAAASDPPGAVAP